MSRGPGLRCVGAWATSALLLLLTGCAATAPVATTPPSPAGTPVESVAPVEGAAAEVAVVPAEAGAATSDVPAASPELPAAGIPDAPPLAEPALPAPSMSATGETRTGAEVFASLRGRFHAPACTDSPRVRDWQKRYAGHPTVFARRLEEILPLLDFVSTETEASGLPAEFTFIPLVESWYEPGAIGRNGPAGMWQMIGSTARNHGIRIGKGYDGRLSPVESTRAALSYLRTLGGMFDGDWQAMVMAYNAGEGRLQGALRRSGRRVAAEEGLPAGLSNITYDYVAKLQALSCLVAEPARHRLALPDTARFARLGAVLVDSRLATLDQVARRAGVPAEQLRGLNPAYRSGRIAGDAPRVLLMPLGASGTLLAAADAPYEPHPGSPTNDADAADDDSDEASPGAAGASGTHRVRSGDTLSQIARRYGVTLQALLRINRLGSKSRIHPGQVLRLVP
jgi:membrane-bound lytic murein transglycosylase D